MHCDEFEARLDDLLDQRLDPQGDAVLLEHARGCAACRGRMAAYVTLAAGVEQLAIPEPDANLSRRVLAQLQPPRVFRMPRYRWVAAVAAAAAVLAVVLPLAWRMLNPPPTALPGDRQLVQQPQQPGQPQDTPRPDGGPVVADRPIGELAREATDTYLVLARQMQQNLSDSLLLVPGINPSVAETVAADEPPKPGNRWMDVLAEGLAPLSKSTASALDSLLLAIPAAEEDSRS